MNPPNNRMRHLLDERIDSVNLWPAIAEHLHETHRPNWYGLRAMGAITAALVLGLALWLTLRPHSVSAREIVLRTKAASLNSAGLQSYHIVQTGGVNGSAEESSVELWYQADGRMAVQNCSNREPHGLPSTAWRVYCLKKRYDGQYLWISYSRDGTTLKVTRMDDTQQLRPDERLLPSDAQQSLQDYLGAINIDMSTVTVEVSGTTTVAGRPAYELVLTEADTPPTHLWVDSEYFVPLGWQQGKHWLTTTLLEINPELDASIFSGLAEGSASVFCIGAQNAPYCKAPNPPHFRDLERFPGAIALEPSSPQSNEYIQAISDYGAQMDFYALPADTDLEALHDFYAQQFSGPESVLADPGQPAAVQASWSWNDNNTLMFMSVNVVYDSQEDRLIVQAQVLQ